MKRLLSKSVSMILVVAMLFGFVQYTPNLKAEAAASGTCGENLTWTLDDGGTLTISGTGAMKDYGWKNSPFFGNSSIKNAIICDGVTTIGDWAFEYCSSLTSVTIPDSVTTIGYSAFDSCSSLTSITIPDSVTTIGYSAFDSCGSLTSITIPDSVTTIGNYAFYYCRNLTSVTIPDSVTTIGDEAFMGCSSLTSITIPNSVTTIGDEAFMGCSSLTSVTIPDSVTSIGDSAFGSCSSLTSVTIPDSVTTIDNSAFYNCISLTSITIPDSVTTIGDGAFKYCTSLTNVTIPDSVTTIGDSAFRFCSSLTSITIPDSVTTIGDSAFYGCNSLTSITIPDSVTTIGDYVFDYCNNLTSITIPDSVTTIGNYAFEYCRNLTDVYYSGTEEQWNNISIIGISNNCLLNATIHFNPSDNVYRINFDTDRWNFANQSTKIDLPFYTRLYGITQGIAVYNSDKTHGQGGQCYGMAATTATINNKRPDVHTFSSNKLVDVGLNDITSEFELSAADFIKYGHILQFCPDISKQKNSTNNKYQDLYNAIYNFVYMGGDPIIIEIRGDFGSQLDCGHALYAVGLGRVTDSMCEIIVNDSNHPNTPMTLTIFKDSNGAFTGWEYPIFNNVTWGSSMPHGRIYYSTPAELLYYVGYYYKEQYKSGFSGWVSSYFDSSLGDMLLLSTDAQNIEIFNDDVNYTDDLIEVFTESGEMDGDKTDLYWLDADGKINFDNLKETEKLSVSGINTQIDFESVNENIEVTVENYNIESADINFEQKDDFIVKYSFPNDKNALDTISISATSDGKFSASVDENNITVTGVSNVEIETIIDGKTELATLPSATGVDKIKIEVDKSGDEPKVYISSGETPSEKTEVTRLAGFNRYDTAIAISNQGWETADTVILANGTNYADALAGVSLASKLDAPILLTRNGNVLETNVAKQIQTLGANNIIILGGPGAVSTGIQASLSAMSYNVERISGFNRYQTAVAISKKVSENPQNVIIVTGEGYADALSISPYAAMKGCPIVYADPLNGLSSITLGYIENAENATIIGGPGAVGTIVNNQLDGKNIDRIFGFNKYLTSYAIADKFSAEFGNDVMLATGTSFPDALAGGVLAAKLGTPLLLTDPIGVIPNIKTFILNKNPKNIYILGGTGIMPDSIVEKIYE